MLTLTLDKMVHGGFALGRLKTGQVALVRGGLPGETVEVALTRRSGVLRGDVVQVLEAHPDRIPPSPHPGLDYSFIRYDRQLALKRDVVLDTLQRASKTDMLKTGASKTDMSLPPVVPAPALWHYRHAVQSAVTPEGLGYRTPASDEVVVLDADPVAHESINAAWRTWLEVAQPKGVLEVVWRCNDAGEVLACLIAKASPHALEPLAESLLARGLVSVSAAPHDPRGRFRQGFTRLGGQAFIHQRYGEVTLSVSATSFAQPNPEAASRLFTDLTALAGEGTHALDLYAGGGVIGLHLSQTFTRVTAIELDRDSIRRGKADAKRLGRDNLRFIRGDARLLEGFQGADLLCVDPPRAGLNKEVRQAITESSAKRLIYVSCDVATWARDVVALAEAGFGLEHAQPYDFYPHTHHIEMLSLLTR